MAGYLIVAEAEDGSWWGEPDTANSRHEARTIALGKWEGSVPEGYEIMIYPIGLGERVDLPKSDKSEAA